MTKSTTDASPKQRAGQGRKRYARPARKAPAPDNTSGTTEGRQTKAAILTGLLSRPEGASIAQLTEATGWQAHSVRGFLAGTLKKRPGTSLTSEKTEAGRFYLLVTDQGGDA